MTTFTKRQYELISNALHCLPEDIRINDDCRHGMTNTNVIIDVCESKKYIVRLPGKGTDKLVDRTQEYNVYQFLHNIGYEEHTVFIHPSGLKITDYFENAYTCDPTNFNQVSESMRILREFHNCRFTPDVKYFSLPAKIDEYRELAKISIDEPCANYHDVYDRCMNIAAWIEKQPRETCLCQIDANPDNILFQKDVFDPILIDWEYGALQDPHLDIAMWATYCNYDTTTFNRLIDAYFHTSISNDVRFKIYGYAALSGLLWYNWCVYKQRCGVEYGEYIRHQFEYASKYSLAVSNYIKGEII